MLSINEIFYSIQGESTYAGKPCVFVRLAGCDLRCSWCDTPYAFNDGRKMSVDDVLQQVDRHGSPLVEVTGGEPLLQEDVYPLMERLLESGRTVLLETGGQIDVSRVPGAVIKVLDVKCPASGESGKVEWGNIDRLGLARSGEVRHPGSGATTSSRARPYGGTRSIGGAPPCCSRPSTA